MNKKPCVLLIMDGYGLGPENADNAVFTAATPRLDRLFAECPHTTLRASGLDVGLPDGQIGNSEVGHTNIGAGRVVFQALPKISNAIADGSFFENKAYRDAMDDAKADGTTLHILGLCSDGGVHSHLSHIFALAEMAEQRGLDRIRLHLLLDGRDVPPESGAGFLKETADFCRKLPHTEIATIQGRFYGMDRDKRGERLQRGYDALVRGIGTANADPVNAVEASYAAGITDEFLEPVIVDGDGLIRDGDSVIFANFRPDRAREITRALTGNQTADFRIDTEPLRLHFVCTAQYDESLPLPVAFPPERIDDTLGEYLSRRGKTQLRIAETEKYAHVTFFLNGGSEEVFPGEDRVLIPSPKSVPTYDLIPEMSAYAVTDECVRRMESGAYDAVVCNLANCDMVGHTGVFAAAVKAVETVDTCVGRIVDTALSLGGTVLITADHGNADRMREADGSPHTAHTTNPVPLILVGADRVLKGGRLCDLAPTMLELMGLEKPEAMTGGSLLVPACAGSSNN